MFDSLAYRLQDAEVAISSVSQHWSQQRQALSSELRRQMRTRHSPIVDQVPIALDDVVVPADVPRRCSKSALSQQMRLRLHLVRAQVCLRCLILVESPPPPLKQ